jgi:cell wall-associated NlpC family hydrolase
MTEQEQRAAIVAEAKSWLGTPYHHYGKLKGIGADCSQMPIKVYAAAGVFEDFDTGPYPTDWHLHRAEERYLGFVRRRAREITLREVKPGDFAVFKIGRCFAHGAIVIDWPLVIHAYIRRGVVYGEATKGEFANRAVKYFTFWNEP